MKSHRVVRWLKAAFFLAVLATGAGFADWHWSRGPRELPKFQTATITRGDLVQAVTASGQLNPVVKVEVGSQISGNIQKLFADYARSLRISHRSFAFVLLQHSCRQVELRLAASELQLADSPFRARTRDDSR